MLSVHGSCGSCPRNVVRKLLSESDPGSESGRASHKSLADHT